MKKSRSLNPYFGGRSEVFRRDYLNAKWYIAAGPYLGHWIFYGFGTFETAFEFWKKISGTMFAGRSSFLAPADAPPISVR